MFPTKACTFVADLYQERADPSDRRTEVPDGAPGTSAVAAKALSPPTERTSIPERRVLTREHLPADRRSRPSVHLALPGAKKHLVVADLDTGVREACGPQPITDRGGINRDEGLAFVVVP